MFEVFSLNFKNQNKMENSEIKDMLKMVLANQIVIFRMLKNANYPKEQNIYIEDDAKELNKLANEYLTSLKNK